MWEASSRNGRNQAGDDEDGNGNVLQLIQIL